MYIILSHNIIEEDHSKNTVSDPQFLYTNS